MLKKILSYFSLFALTICSFQDSVLAEAPIPNREKMLFDLDILKNSFEIKYAPAEWKHTFADWDLEEQILVAKTKVLEDESLSLKKYQHILHELFNTTKDYHVKIHFYSTELAFLPFRIQSAPVQNTGERKYHLAWVYTPFFEFFFKESLKKGDEVLYFNDEPVDVAVQALQKVEFGNPDSKTDQALAESALTFRLGSKGHYVPQGPVSITVRRAGTDQVVKYQMEWLYQEEEVLGSSSPLEVEGSDAFVIAKGKKTPLGARSFFHKDMSTPLFKNHKTDIEKSKQLLAQKMGQGDSLTKKLRVQEEEEDEWDSHIGARKSSIPELGKVLWRPKGDNPFHAYLYLSTNGRKVGYVRIPTFIGGEYFALQFAEIIAYFEKQSAALVIDQTNNPGGNVFYMYALASMLSDKPLIVPKHREMYTQEDVLTALEIGRELDEVTNDEEAINLLGETISGYPVDYELAQAILSYSRFVLEQWQSGKKVSDATALYGLEALRPYPEVRYTKPILLLVNMLDFSCADFLPAILQDNGRATILGTRTAGAGGYVLGHSYPNRFGIEGYSFTASLAERVDQNPIENLGVTPDQLVDLTAKDLEFGYQEFANQIKKAVLNLIN